MRSRYPYGQASRRHGYFLDGGVQGAPHLRYEAISDDVWISFQGPSSVGDSPHVMEDVGTSS